MLLVNKILIAACIIFGAGIAFMGIFGGIFIVQAFWDLSHSDLYIENAADGHVIRRISHSSIIDAAIFAPNGKFMISASRNGKVWFWSVPRFRHLRTIEGTPGSDIRAFISPDSRYVGQIASCDETPVPGAIRIWRTTDGKEVPASQVAAIARANHIELYDDPKEGLQGDLKPRGTTISPSKRYYAVGLSDWEHRNTIIIKRTSDCSLVRKLEIGYPEVTFRSSDPAAFITDNTLLVSSREGRNLTAVSLWNIDTGKSIYGQNWRFLLDVSEDRKYIAITDSDRGD